MQRNYFKVLAFTFILFAFNAFFVQAHAGSLKPNNIVVIQTDFSLKDGAVNAIKGVMYSVNKSLIISDLTHEIPAYNIAEASYRLFQVAPYWPKGTVFVSVVDPGVGTSRRSIVAESKNGYYFVTPDNGTLTLIDDQFGLKAVRQIDENKNRLKGSGGSHTFHGRDVYGYTAARLASQVITFEEVGPEINTPIVKYSYEKAAIKNNKLSGTIVTLDPEYGNVWTNIDDKLTKKFHIEKGKVYTVKIYQNDIKKYEGQMTFQKTFGDVGKNTDLLYINSLMNLAIGINQGNFAKENNISFGPDWKIEIQK